MTDKTTTDQTTSAPRVRPGSKSPADGILMADPMYKELLTHYQNAEWAKCSALIDQLLVLYPGRKILLDFKSDIDVQLMLNQISVNRSKDKTRKNLLSLLMIFLGVVAVLAVIAFFAWQAILSARANLAATQQQALLEKQQIISQLEAQAQSALQAGKPDVALEVAATIEAQDPSNPAVSNLRNQANNQLQLVALYDQAVQAQNNQGYSQALELFQRVQAANPLFRDVGYQIKWTENKIKVTQLVADGNTAYEQKNWIGAIQAYEGALDLDPSINNQQIKDQLLYSYLKSIVETLSKNEQTIEELERSGSYYRKAISLIPQDRNYIAEREHLQALSKELLISKNYQMAKNLLRDPHQTRSMIAKAITFLQNALELKPEDSTFTAELNKAQLYYTGLQYFDLSKMTQAIAIFEELAKFDRSYPNGMGHVYLYEAYVANGLKLHKDGFYLDARSNFDKAELIAWDHPENKMELFLVQVNQGNTLAKLENYADAVSYIEYALKSIPNAVAAVTDPGFKDLMVKAADFSGKKDFASAYAAYAEALKQMDLLFTFKEMDVTVGDTLVFLSTTYNTTVQAIQLFNNVEFPTITRDQTIKVPTLP